MARAVAVGIRDSFSHFDKVFPDLSLSLSLSLTEKHLVVPPKLPSTRACVCVCVCWMDRATPVSCSVCLFCVGASRQMCIERSEVATCPPPPAIQRSWTAQCVCVCASMVHSMQSGWPKSNTAAQCGHRRCLVQPASRIYFSLTADAHLATDQPPAPPFTFPSTHNQHHHHHQHRKRGRRDSRLITSDSVLYETNWQRNQPRGSAAHLAIESNRNSFSNYSCNPAALIRLAIQSITAES